jgi:hypothetical protein
MKRSAGCSIVLLFSAGLGVAVAQSPAFDVLAPFSPARRSAIEAGRPIVELTSESDVDVALIGAVRTIADDARLVAWFREVEQLQRGKYIPVVRRFSDPPRIEDLAELALDEDDLEDLRDCRPGHCDLKLAGYEMVRIRAAIDAAGEEWEPAAQQAFRQVILARAVAHIRGGFANALPYDDHKTRAVPVSEFEHLLAGSELPGLCMKPVIAHLRAYPRADGGVETFLFWSKDMLGDLKPVVSITQVSIIRSAWPDQPTIVASAQVYASHYLTASLSVVAVAGEPDGERYLVYARRSRGDLFTGPFGGWVRRIVQKRVRAEGPGVLDGLRRKIEAGPPGSNVSRR